MIAMTSFVSISTTIKTSAWVNVPLATGATINVGGAGDVFYAWETYLTNGQTGVRTILATAGTTPPLPGGGTASHPLAPANNDLSCTRWCW